MRCPWCSLVFACLAYVSKRALRARAPIPPEAKWEGSIQARRCPFQREAFIQRGRDSLWTKRQLGRNERRSFAHFIMERLEVAYPGLARDRAGRGRRGRAGGGRARRGAPGGRRGEGLA